MEATTQIHADELARVQAALGTHLFPYDTEAFLQVEGGVQDVRELAYNAILGNIPGLKEMRDSELYMLSERVQLANTIHNANAMAQPLLKQSYDGDVPVRAFGLPHAMAKHLQTVPIYRSSAAKFPVTDFFKNWHGVKSPDLSTRGALQGILLRMLNNGSTRTPALVVAPRDISGEPGNIGQRLFGDDTFKNLTHGISIGPAEVNGSYAQPNIFVTGLTEALRLAPTLYQLKFAFLNYAPSADFHRVQAMLTELNTPTVVFGSDFSIYERNPFYPDSRYITADEVTVEQFQEQCLPGKSQESLARIITRGKKDERPPIEFTKGGLRVDQVPVGVILSRLKGDPRAAFAWLQENFPYSLHNYDQDTKKASGFECFSWEALQKAERRFGLQPGEHQVFFDRVVTGNNDRAYYRQLYSYNLLRHILGDDKVIKPVFPRIESSVAEMY